MEKKAIGIFDSGVGGLTVVKQVMRVMPNENIVYFGDTARLPYGSKSAEVVTKFSLQNVRFLQTQDVKAIIVACNTASSNSLEALRAAFDVPIFGVVDAGVALALKTTKNGKIGLIGTAGTVRSGAYETMLRARDASVSVFSKACPLFVPLAEEGFAYHEIARLTAQEYLSEMMAEGIDSLILGCTHYPLLKACIGGVVGEDVRLVDPAELAAQQVKTYLEEHDLCRGEETDGEARFFLSDETEMFARVCETALYKIPQVEQYTAEVIDIERY